MKKILIGLAVILTLALTSVSYAGDYYRNTGYSVYAGFYGPPVFNVVIGNGYSGFGFYLNGFGGYYGYSKPYYGYGYIKPYSGEYTGYKYTRPHRYGYRNTSTFYGRGYRSSPRRGYRR
jgi:hypothetical protein